MTTLYLDWNGDFIITPSGSLQMASGWDEVRQRILRRIVTNPAQQLPSGDQTTPDYVFHSDYGDGLGAEVDEDINEAYLKRVEGRIRNGILADSAVDQSQIPQVSFSQPNPNTVIATAVFKLSNGDPGTIQVQLT